VALQDRHRVRQAQVRGKARQCAQAPLQPDPGQGLADAPVRAAAEDRMQARDIGAPDVERVGIRVEPPGTGGGLSVRRM